MQELWSWKIQLSSWRRISLSVQSVPRWDIRPELHGARCGFVYFVRGRKSKSVEWAECSGGMRRVHPWPISDYRGHGVVHRVRSREVR